jgi:hypothetical protein
MAVAPVADSGKEVRPVVLEHKLPPVAAQANGQVKEYLVAHTDVWPSLQGAVPYVRTFSVKDADSAQ